MSRKPVDILTPFQKSMLRTLAGEPLLKDFYLTGGTALSAFYLQHRLSDDLDFFTEAPGAVARIPAVLRRIAKKHRLRFVLGRRFQTLFECTLVGPGAERLEMNFALDMPGRLVPVRKIPGVGIRVDNLRDIACNKLSALLERVEPKDFVDLYCLDRDFMPLPKLIVLARRKYRELDDYALAMACFKVKGVTMLPKMLIPLDLPTLKAFFLVHAKRLTRGITRPH